MIANQTAHVLRLFADADGESRFGLSEWPMAEQYFAPPAAPFSVSEVQTADRLVVIELPVDWGGDEPHPTPARHVLVCLSGQFKIETSDGDCRSFQAGDILFMEDVSGKGHRTWVTSTVSVRAIMIRLV
jgi:hypothetical protein